MRLRYAGGVGLVISLGLSLGCSTGQQLQSIAVTPANVVFGGADPTLHAQLTATGTYTHPPATKDITSQVTWASSVTQVAQVTNTGMVSPNTNCGVSNVTASLTTNQPRGNVVSGAATVTVDGPTTDNCPSSTP
jgi:hypothetical protein